jgi:hypothetical protein
LAKTYPYPHETNSLTGTGLSSPTSDQRVYWTDPDLAKITRLRLLSDSYCKWWDVSYCWGELKDGTTVRVQLPFPTLRKIGRSGVDRSQIVQYAQADKLYVKRLGIFDAISTCY